MTRYPNPSGYLQTLCKLLPPALLLGTGLAAYWLFRPEIYIFSWLRIENPYPLSSAGSPLYVFLKNHFADIAWCIAVFQTASWLKSIKSPTAYRICLLFLPFASEILQATGHIQGTFDWIDLFLYSIIFILFYWWEGFYMRKTINHLAGIAAVAVLAFAVIGSGSKPRPPAVYENGTITFEKKQDDIFSKPSLRRILSSSRKLGIVLRVPNADDKVTQEQRQSYKMREIERELAKAGYIVRDQAFFEKVLDREGLDYAKIGQLTETDLIIELVSFSKQTFTTREYVDDSGAKKTATRDFSVSGASVEFKLTSVKENDMIGSYVFHYTPCTEGCKQRFSTNRGYGYKLPEQKTTEELFRIWAERLIAQLRKR